MLSKFYRTMFRVNGAIGMGLDLSLLLMTTLAAAWAFRGVPGILLGFSLLLANIWPIALTMVIMSRSDELLDSIERHDVDPGNVVTAKLEKVILLSRKMTFWTAVGIVGKLMYLALAMLAAFFYVEFSDHLYWAPAALLTGYLFSVIGGLAACAVNRLDGPLQEI